MAIGFRVLDRRLCIYIARTVIALLVAGFHACALPPPKQVLSALFPDVVLTCAPNAAPVGLQWTDCFDVQREGYSCFIHTQATMLLFPLPRRF